jgi:hypothetical protein
MDTKAYEYFAGAAPSPVAQVSNLPYRGFPTRKTLPFSIDSNCSIDLPPAAGLPIGNRRYSRLETCATSAPNSSPRQFGVAADVSPRTSAFRSFVSTRHAILKNFRRLRNLPAVSNFRHSVFGFPSDFELRISDFAAPPQRRVHSWFTSLPTN